MAYELEKQERSFIPFEGEDQKVVFRWAVRQIEEKRYPELGLMYMLPNAARRSFAFMQSVERPWLPIAPNICVPVPKGGYGALYLELRQASAKRRKQDEYEEFMEGLRVTGNAAVTATDPTKRSLSFNAI